MRVLKLIVFGFVQIVLTVIFVTNSFAQNITVEVSGNGENSANSVNLATTQQTSIQSENTAQVSNNLNSQATTGGNLANSNTGNAQITTGNVGQSLAIDNNANTNLISTECGGCDPNLTIENSGNGANSVNTINTQIENTTDILAVNQANITNNAQGSAVTGKNTANNNVGNVKIETGNINVAGKISNFANLTQIVVDPDSSSNIQIKNSGNGANSINFINVEILNLVNIEKIDIWQLENNIFWEAITGENSCANNVGDCEILTGDINISFEIANSGNFDFVFVQDPKLPPIGGLEPEIPGEPTPEQPQPAAPGPPSPSAPSQLGPAGPPGPGQVLAALAQLPVTGPSGFVFLILFWIFLACTGVVLKRLGNKSPPAKVFAKFA